MQYVSQSTGLYTSINIGQHLGSGTFGTAYQLLDVFCVPNGFVCKTVNIAPNNSWKMSQKDIVNATINEIHSLEKMNLLEGYARDNHAFYIIMKKVNGSPPQIHDLDSAQPSFSALRDCHRQNITHFDASPSNLIKQINGSKVTAIDFGLSSNGTFFNIGLDVYTFLILNGIVKMDDLIGAFINALILFVIDYVDYVKRNKIEAFTTIAWWGMLLYGAQYGLPTLLMPQHFFYDYLRSKIYHQLFLEIRSIGFTPFRMLLTLSKLIVNDDFVTSIREASIFKNILKPVYLIGLYFPYTQLKNFYATNVQLVEKCWAFLTKNNITDKAAELISSAKSTQSSFSYDASKKLVEDFYQLLTKENIQETLAAPTTNTCLQAALLYHPIKAGLTFVNDAIINPLQPEFIAKARADLYFQHHPKLYLKAAASMVCDAAEPMVNYFKPEID